MIPGAEPLQEAARQPSVGSESRSQLAEIMMFLGDVLPSLESAIVAATDGPAPLDAASRLLVTAGGKRIRPLAALLSCAIAGGAPKRAVDVAAARQPLHSATPP